MKNRLKLFGIVGLFWICFFEVCRIIFLLYHIDEASSLSFRDVATILFLGLRMDLAMTGYWLIAAGLLLTLPVKKFNFIYYLQNFLPYCSSRCVLQSLCVILNFTHTGASG